MYLGIPESNFVRFGIDTKETKEHIIDVIVREYKDKLYETRPQTTMGQLMTLTKILREELAKYTLTQLLQNSKEDASSIIAVRLQNMIFMPLCDKYPKFKEMMFSDPQLSEDEYWDEFNVTYDIIAKSIGGTPSPFGGYDIDEFMLLGAFDNYKVSKIQDKIKVTLPQFFI